MNRLILISFFLILQGCNSVKKNYMEENEVDVKKESQSIFGNYNYELKEGMQRGFANYYNIFISKKDLSLVEFGKIKNNIEKRWKLVYVSEDQYVFCYNRFNQMTVIYPNRMEYYDKFGEKIYIRSESLDKWIISLKYIKDGTSYCKSEF